MTRTIDMPGVTLEDWMRKALKEGKEAEVVALMRTLPLEKREHYRKVWQEVKHPSQELGALAAPENN